MLPISDSDDRMTFKLLLSFLGAGGIPLQRMTEFASRYHIDIPRLQDELKKDKAAVYARLRLHNLL